MATWVQVKSGIANKSTIENISVFHSFLDLELQIKNYKST